MKLYHTTDGPVLSADDRSFRLDTEWDDLLRRDDLPEFLGRHAAQGEPVPASHVLGGLLPPVRSQPVWASGVTYYRSREARMEEAEAAGGGGFYDRVYTADRPELFFKATPELVVGPGGTMRLRRDSSWIVPEPELTLVISPGGRITGYTIGNDLSCRDIEGENPLYLPQAKTFDGCAGLGPCIRVMEGALPTTTKIQLEIRRSEEAVFADETELAQMKRTPNELVGYLLRELSIPNGCLLMTGTGIVPPDEFSLQAGDEIRITIEPIGTLTNFVA